MTAAIKEAIKAPSKSRRLLYETGHDVHSLIGVLNFPQLPCWPMRRCNSFVADHNLDGWEWTVTAVDAGWNPVASSPVGLFKFAPCRLADGRSCSAPATPE